MKVEAYTASWIEMILAVNQIVCANRRSLYGFVD